MKTIRDINKTIACKLPNGWDENDRPNPRIIAHGKIVGVGASHNCWWVELRKRYRSLPMTVPVYREDIIPFRAMLKK